MSEDCDAVGKLSAFLEETKRTCLAEGSFLLEANADALQFMLGTASSWPDFREMSLIYQQALCRLTLENQDKLFNGKAFGEETLPEIISAARQAPQAFDGLYAALAKYGSHSLVALLSMISITMSIKDIFASRREEIAALQFIANFISSLDKCFIRNRLHRVAIAIATFEP